MNRFDEAAVALLERTAARFGRGVVKRDPRECVDCGQLWKRIDLAEECCQPLGIARAEALDTVQEREAGGWGPTGSTSEIESWLDDPTSPMRDELVQAFLFGRRNAGGSSVRLLAIKWQESLMKPEDVKRVHAMRRAADDQYRKHVAKARAES